jgi:hypothetical protein
MIYKFLKVSVSEYIHNYVWKRKTYKVSVCKLDASRPLSRERRRENDNSTTWAGLI